MRAELPLEDYTSHVEALFSGGATFAIGVAGSSSMLLVAGIAGHHAALIAIASAVLVLGAVRLWSMRRFAAVRPRLGPAGLRRWERWYIAGGSASLALMGAADFHAFAFTEDSFARLAALAVIMAYLVGTPGRSFASPTLVNVQILAAAVPVLLGLALAGGWNWCIGVFVMAPFFVALKAISARLNGIFVAAVTRASELKRLASRFDTAVSNMPQGLVMFEPDGTIAIASDRLRAMLGVAPGPLPAGADLGWLAAVWRGVGPDDRLVALLQDPEPSPAGSVAETWDGRYYACRLQRLDAGGGVLIVEDVTSRVLDRREIDHLARYDALTGMLNRRAFRDAVEAGADAPGLPAVLFVDLDRFKQVNDTLGHLIGDRLVVAVADRLRAAAGPDALLARIGGDEFVLYRSFPGGLPEAERVAVRVIGRLSEPYEIEGQRITVGASIGIAGSVEPGLDIDAMLRDADLALYQAKADGRGLCRVFRDDMKVAAEQRRRTEEDLRGAVERGELEVFYQPIYDVVADRVAVCEALLRWRHPVRGFVSPGEFIPIAEEAGLIGDIGRWVLVQACAECAAWPQGVAVAVNVSAAQFRRGDAVAAIRDALDATGLPAERLEVEITESVMIDDKQGAAAMLEDIAAMGVGVSLDDFGTGYSSLSYLHSLPFSKVKVDQSFLRGADLGERALLLLRNICNLCADLGMAVVMEGVETQEQMELLIGRTEVRLVQGYLLGRPMPASDIRARLDPSPSRRVA
ncbi:EAL domain-containing protein [Lichenibacterium dinghuense]|uniref:EAL domain-containing protein n=1 Tax=Lichenibacterium dinghuense TaxID=2895977 RepID=UPI001F3B00A5|nr:EAL domain-containing protein [Lichenibacterium sp. 6Y81]